MKLTKYEHACFIVENEQGQKIIVDPGAFSSLPSDLSGIIAVVITHAHADHFDLENVQKIADQNSNIKIFGPEETIEKHSLIVNPEKNKIYEQEQFTLEFYGDKHEFIREGIPIVCNLGVVINGRIAYPGDSYSQYAGTVDYLLAPASAPWMRMKEASEFIISAQAKNIIPTHDALLSEIGKATHDNHLKTVANSSGKTYKRLKTGQSIDL